ncbi:uncharacterized protein LOC112467233 [Temnothorax curvispinosus]|uniref:Uncharacterized protein LOC112467233 n=1 Tax=Temnothorax curvispinosus TaxID=300111 RepID=A0A6J1RFB3_9HYME|nr:uncharacterized protein LOC112467233 [Temnothorax curvispinosus]
MTERNKKVDATRGKGISNKLMEVIHEIKKLDMDIVALSETKKKGSGNIAINDYVLIWSGIPKVERAKAGVALLVKRKWVKYIKDIQYVNEQCLVVKIELYGRVASILAVYAPTEDSPEQVKTEFYEELTSLIQNIPNRQQIIVAGDMNARVGSRVGDEVGRYGEVVVNSNRGKLIEFCKQHDLQITNSHFNHKKIYRFTWERASLEQKSIIDYVIVRQDTLFRVNDTRVKRGPNCGSDHYLVVSKCFFPIVSQKIRAEEEDGAMGKIELPKYKTYLLQQDSIRGLYERRLNGYLQTNHESAQGEEMDIENDHEHILEAVHQAARKVMGTVKQQRKPSQGWWSEEMADAVKEKERAYNSWLSHRTAESRRDYNRSKAAGLAISKELKNKLNLITLNEPANYYEKLLTETRPQFTSGVVNIEATNGVSESIDVSPQQVRRAIYSIKNGKAPGSGEQWKTSFITSLYKKEDRKDMSNYRGLSVNSTLSRLFGKIIKALLEDKIGSTVSEEQSGFTAGRSCVDNLFVVQQLLKKRIAKDLETHITFIDLKKAYDSVPRNRLWQVLCDIGINSNIIQVIQEMYAKNKAYIKEGTRLSRPLIPTKELRQGCSLLPTLFNIYLEAVLKK